LGLVDLVVTPGVLSPAFSPATTAYTVALTDWEVSVLVTARVALGAAFNINGLCHEGGTACVSGGPVYVELQPGMTTILLTVVSPVRDIQTYSVVVTRAPVTPTYFKAGHTDAYARFGHSVSIWGDTMAIGAPAESSNATGINGDQADASVLDRGAVFVFQRTGGTWAQQAYIKPSNAGPIEFGTSVSLVGDTLVVGAPHESSKATGINGDQTDTSALDSGAVYVFQRTGSTWAQQAYLKASNTGAGDSFGTSLSLAADTLAVGATGEASKATGINGDQTDNSVPGSGAVYVFQRTSTSWVQQAYVKNSPSQANSYFGYSVSVSGDTLAVGAPGAGAPEASVGMEGRAYIFQRGATTWIQQASMKSDYSYISPAFGSSVALLGDLLAVGSNVESGSGKGVNGALGGISQLYTGATWLFRRSGPTWPQLAYIKASNAQPGFRFGSSVALDGNHLAVGSEGETSTATGVDGNQYDGIARYSGAVYLYAIPPP
jgi:hypothetical protein